MNVWRAMTEAYLATALLGMVFSRQKRNVCMRSPLTATAPFDVNGNQKNESGVLNTVKFSATLFVFAALKGREYVVWYF